MACIAACSAEVATPVPQVDGRVAGGEPAGGTPAPDAGNTSTTTPPPSSSGGSSSGSSSGGTIDAGGPPVTVTADSGSPSSSGGYFIDSGSTPPPSQGGALGTCGNPACATDGNECGCQATDSNGDTVQMGCQAGGECVCVVNQQTTGQPFDENGACSDQQSTAQQFIQYCQCQ
jgi:hypothetical protein